MLSKFKVQVEVVASKCNNGNGGDGREIDETDIDNMVSGAFEALIDAGRSMGQKVVAYTVLDITREEG